MRPASSCGSSWQAVACGAARLPPDPRATLPYVDDSPAPARPTVLMAAALEEEPITIARPPSTSGPDDPRRTRGRRIAVAGALVLVAAAATGLTLGRHSSQP